MIGHDHDPIPRPISGPAVSEDAAIDRLLAVAADLERHGASLERIWSILIGLNVASARPVRLADLESICPRPEPRPRSASSRKRLGSLGRGSINPR